MPKNGWLIFVTMMSLLVVFMVMMLLVAYDHAIRSARWGTGPCSKSDEIYGSVSVFGKITHVFLGEEVPKAPKLSMYQMLTIEGGIVVIEKPQLPGNDFDSILEAHVIQYRNREACATWIKETGIDLRPKKPKKVYVTPAEIFSF